MSNLKPFDIEAVKAGKKFVHKFGYKPVDFETTRFGIYVKWGDYTSFYEPEDYHYLRMAPEERDVWINVWRDDQFNIYTMPYKDEQTAKFNINQISEAFTLLETIHRKYEI